MNNIQKTIVSFLTVIILIACDKDLPEESRTTSLQGTISNSLDRGVKHANIRISLDGIDGEYFTTTNDNGHFLLNNLPLGYYYVEIYCNLYDTLRSGVELALQDQIYNAKLMSTKLRSFDITIKNHFNSIQIETNIDNTLETFKCLEIYKDNELVDKTYDKHWQYNSTVIEDFAYYHVSAVNIDNTKTISSKIVAKIHDKPYFSGIQSYDYHFYSQYFVIKLSGNSAIVYKFFSLQLIFSRVWVNTELIKKSL